MVYIMQQNIALCKIFLQLNVSPIWQTNIKVMNFKITVHGCLQRLLWIS